MAAAGVGRPGQQRGIGRPGILDWPQPEQQVPSRQVSAAPAAAAAPTDLRAHYLAAASAVSSAGYARSAPQEDSGRHQEGIDHRKAAKEAFLAGRQPVAGEANRVGVGAFAEVRCATGPDGRRMAVKTYEGLRDNPAAAEQVEAEAALAGLRLQHANIFAPEAVRRAAGGDRAEVWMALAEGGSLGDLIKRAKYGGGGLSYPVRAGGLNFPRACSTSSGSCDATSWLGSRCNGRSSCSFSVSNAMCGDPWNRCPKWLGHNGGINIKCNHSLDC